MDLYQKLGYDVWNLVDHEEYSLLTTNDVTHYDLTHNDVTYSSESILSAEDEDVTRYLAAYYPNPIPQRMGGYLKTLTALNSVPPPAPKQVALPTKTSTTQVSLPTETATATPNQAAKRVSSKTTLSCKRKIDIDDLMEVGSTASVVEFGFKRRKKKSTPQWVLPVMCRAWIGEGKDAQRRQKVLKVLLAHPNISLSLSDLANKVGILLNTLSAAFSVNRMTKYLTEAPFASHKKGVVYRSVVNRQAMFIYKPS